MITRLKLSTIEQGLPKYRSMLAGNDAYIPTSFESIATANGTGSSATITFSSIPGTYQHLQIRFRARNTNASTSIPDVFMRFNSDTNVNSYTFHTLEGTGAAAQANAYTTGTIGCITISGANPSNNNLADTVGVGIVDLLDYASTSKYKTARFINGRDLNNTTGRINLSSGLWLSTSAITSIDLVSESGNWTTSTQFALYGIKGA